MRGAGLIISSFLAAVFLSACAAPAPPSPPAPPPALPAEELPVSAPPPAPAVVPVSAEAPPREPSFEDLLKLQKEIAARRPGRDEEKLRLALLYASAGQEEEADRIFSTLSSRAHPLVPYLDFFLRRRLGDHKEAGRLLARFNEEDRRATGFVIERVELCSRIRRFRDYVPAENDRVMPGGTILLYVEPRNFTLQREGDTHILHLKYEWKLYDDRAAELPVPAWERASAEEREDRVATHGPVTEFYQSFKLPLPANLAAGHYRVKVTVTDVPSGRSDRVYVPLTVAAAERAR